ncbi:anti-phage deoxyguanosine triphosphatase [Xanthobacter autotrophicus]|uniref:anti-phage deoxyguanosine triphosphatase n=1 Tax=Xanthobacter autotrophicus TaxID=280 RepID=UPI00372A3CD3
MSWLKRREKWNPQNEDARETGDIDYARVIHSASFRRLQGKTQILNLGDSDFYRTRLTHSLEVAQIAGGIVKQLKKTFENHKATNILPPRSMIHAIACTHDLGHPPFGHGGEVALNYCMRAHGGFEGNGQSLRILARLESFSSNAGANLCRRSLLGVLKYPISYSEAFNPHILPSLLEKNTIIKVLDGDKCKPPKCYMDSERDVVEWIFEPLSKDDVDKFIRNLKSEKRHAKAEHKSLDCSIMDVADDIAYGVHDLEDAIAMGLVSKESFSVEIQNSCSSFLDVLKVKYPNEFGNDAFSSMVSGLFGSSDSRKRFIGRLVHHFVTAVEFVELEIFDEPLIRYRVKLLERQRVFLDALQKFVFEAVIKSPEVQHLEFKGQQMVVAVFEAMQAEPYRLLPRAALSRFDREGGDLRVISDYVAGMTDTYLLRTYERLFSPRMGSVFDRL